MIYGQDSLFQAHKANLRAMSFTLILNTCPDQNTAMQIAESLVRDNLAACVNILPAGLSVYRWQGKIESAEEHLLIIKTHSDLYTKVEQSILQLHPYELPEIIAVPITRGLPAYLDWLAENVNQQE